MTTFDEPLCYFTALQPPPKAVGCHLGHLTTEGGGKGARTNASHLIHKVREGERDEIAPALAEKRNERQHRKNNLKFIKMKGQL